MDKAIPQEEINRAKRKRWMKIGGVIAGVVVVIVIVSSMFRGSVSRKSLSIGQVSTGTIESTVSASGRVISEIGRAHV